MSAELGTAELGTATLVKAYQVKARDNPFVTENLNSLSYCLQSDCLQSETWEQLVARFRELNFQASVIGPKGNGKTAFLLTFQEILKQQDYAVRYLRYPSERAFSYREIKQYVSQVTSQEIVLLDGGEIRSWSRQVFFFLLRARAKGILMTAHFPCALPCLYRCQTNPGLFAHLLRELLCLSSDVAELEDEETLECVAAEYFNRYKGNLRQAMLGLYDQWYVLGGLPRSMSQRLGNVGQ